MVLLEKSPVLPSEPVRDRVYDGDSRSLNKIKGGMSPLETILSSHATLDRILFFKSSQEPESLVFVKITLCDFFQLPKHRPQQTLTVDRIAFNFSGSFRCFPLTFSFISQMCHVSSFFFLEQRLGCCWLAKGPVVTSHQGPEEEQNFEGQLL